jgi:hypothetical protein
MSSVFRVEDKPGNKLPEENGEQTAAVITSNPANLLLFISICVVAINLYHLALICYYAKSEGQYDAISSPAWNAYQLNIASQ